MSGFCAKSITERAPLQVQALWLALFVTDVQATVVAGLKAGREHGG
jgi:hypothetical protein